MKGITKEQALHRTVIENFLSVLNDKTDKYILKGGTALMLCYGLERFSEDIDLDGSTDQIKDIVDNFCSDNGYNYRIAKDTASVNRFMIHYNGSNDRPLKVEISFRKKDIEPDTTDKINGIRVYKLDTICQQKALAYEGRDKLRDLNDLCFICNNYYDELSPSTINGLTDAVAHKGIEHFDYITHTQSDPLINTDKLAADFLSMMDKLDLISDDEDSASQNIISIRFPSDRVTTTEDRIDVGKPFNIAIIPDKTFLSGRDISGYRLKADRVDEIDGKEALAIFTSDKVKLHDKTGGYEEINISELKDIIEARTDEILSEDKSKDNALDKKVAIIKDKENDVEL